MKKYNIIYADPPWAYRDRRKGRGGAEDHYPTMKLEDICNLPIQKITSPREEHSKKPDIVREKIVELFGDLPRIELFARQSTPGWDVWGNELQSDIIFYPKSSRT